MVTEKKTPSKLEMRLAVSKWAFQKKDKVHLALSPDSLCLHGVSIPVCEFDYTWFAPAQVLLTDSFFDVTNHSNNLPIATAR
jgi:hypothetical protein